LHHGEAFSKPSARNCQTSSWQPLTLGRNTYYRITTEASELGIHRKCNLSVDDSAF
jgi:hypothetical protein